jgi:hypothetical protein
MAAGATYEPIATTTLGSAQASVTFNSFSGYTDLVLIMQGKSSNSTDDPQLYFNSDTGSNYSLTVLSGNSSTASSFRYSNVSNGFYCGLPGWTSSGFTTHIVNIMNYANITTYKSILSRNGANDNASGYNATNAVAGLWRSTSAITSLTVDGGSGNIASGSTFTLYGIAAA